MIGEAPSPRTPEAAPPRGIKAPSARGSPLAACPSTGSAAETSTPGSGGSEWNGLPEEDSSSGPSWDDSSSGTSSPPQGPANAPARPRPRPLAPSAGRIGISPLAPLRVPSPASPPAALPPAPPTVGVASTDLRRPFLGGEPGTLAASLGATVGGPGPPRLYWEGFFVILPVFCGYATLFGMQHHVKARLGIKDDGSRISYDFSFAVSSLYLCNLFSRFGHEVVFGWLTPRSRVFLAMAAMVSSMLVIAGPIFALGCHSLCWVAGAYALGGVGVGTFEANILACLTPLGHASKCFAITAIPAGISLVLVGGFFLIGPPVDLPVVACYVSVAVLSLVGMASMALRIPRPPPGSHGAEPATRPLRALARSFGEYRRWCPQMWHYALASSVDMFALSAFAPGLLQYIYDGRVVEVASGVVMSTDSFFALADVGNLLGGITGRYLSYRLRPRHPLLYCSLTLTGVALLVMWKPALVPLGMFLVMMGDGLIYGTVSKHIDTVVPKEFNLVSISAWLFIGDIGSVIGSSQAMLLKELLHG